MTIRLYDTARAAVVPFLPAQTVRMYICGITPYDSTHLGHAFTYLSHDVLIRRLESLGHEVRMVRNITDVDDPLFEKADELGVHYLELADAEMARFHSDLQALDLRPAAAEPRASESMPAIISTIQILAEQGHTYAVDGTIFFDTSTFDGFGDFARADTVELISLSASRGGTPDDPRQRNPLDFALWKASASGEVSWEAPFGSGRPGWHIECSAMARKELGQGALDLHGGGSDLIFPHHQCEIAQSESAFGEPLANHWMHGGMVGYDGTKMSKSLGNLVFVSDLLKVVEPTAIRAALLAHHYRADFEWVDEEIEAVGSRIDTIADALERLGGPDPDEHRSAFEAALDDDLDTPAALRVIDDWCAEILASPENGDGSSAVALREATELLGITPLPRIS
ncbi:MAG: cysteine--tRNA ligase [Acidobacteria bacterium]|nr:cysteine--tRNA ligase [Acidobacteriota bacterium]